MNILLYFISRVMLCHWCWMQSIARNFYWKIISRKLLNKIVPSKLYFLLWVNYFLYLLLLWKMLNYILLSPSSHDLTFRIWQILGNILLINMKIIVYWFSSAIFFCNCLWAFSRFIFQVQKIYKLPNSHF